MGEEGKGGREGGREVAARAASTGPHGLLCGGVCLVILTDVSMSSNPKDKAGVGAGGKDVAGGKGGDFVDGGDVVIHE